MAKKFEWLAMKQITGRIFKLERVWGTAAIPSAQELKLRATVETICRRRCERLGEPYEPICWDNHDRRPRMGVAETIWSCRLKRLQETGLEYTQEIQVLPDHPRNKSPSTQ